MSAALRDQYWLPFTAEQHFELLHGRHSADVAVCLEPVGDHWREGTYEHDHAAELVAGYARQNTENVYQSQNGFKGWREVAKVSALTSCWVDLDTYKAPELAGIDSYALIDKARAIAPWLPTPTAVISSGRGFYLSWIFQQPLKADALPRWQWVQNVIVNALTPLQADPKCREPARVLRVHDTVNSKNGARVQGWMQTGNPLTFAALEKAATRGEQLAHAERDRVLARPQVARLLKGEITPKARKRGFRNFTRQNQNRLTDCHTLAELRGPMMTDYRHRLLHAYAVAGAWFWSCPEQAEAELAHFALQHFADGHRYGVQKVRSVLKRWEEKLQGVAHTWFNPFSNRLEKAPRRYRMRTSTIIRELEITLEEQRTMLAFVSPEEKARRKVQKRREAGVEPMEAIHARSDETRAVIVQMHREGRKQKDIAASIGKTPSWVCQVLKDARGSKN